MKKANSKSLTPRQKKELAALARLPDGKIDTDLIPEARNWRHAKRGLFADADIPEMTANDFARAKSLRAAMPEVVKAMKRGRAKTKPSSR